MSWTTYRLVLHLRSPLHIGRGKVGNVQRTRPYVTGRVLWGALTERLTRDAAPGPATDSALYRTMGDRVHDTLAFTYLYPTTEQTGEIELWPWDDDFRPRFLSAYASTALTYPQQSAEEGSLHEIECIVPHTVDTGQAVYLSGYLFARDDAPSWESALHRLQMGGERGYGWGWVEPIATDVVDGHSLFGGLYTVEPDARRPVLVAGADAPLLAHALAADFDKGKEHRATNGVRGVIEPLVGRETHADGRSGVRVGPAIICYAPGSRVQAGVRFRIGPYGVWQSRT